MRENFSFKKVYLEKQGKFDIMERKYKLYNGLINYMDWNYIKV